MTGNRLSCGVVVARETDAGWLTLLLRAYHHWDFPKGIREAGEESLQAALREVREETSIDDLEFDWGDRHFETGQNDFFGYDVDINVDIPDGQEAFEWTMVAGAPSHRFMSSNGMPQSNMRVTTNAYPAVTHQSASSAAIPALNRSESDSCSDMPRAPFFCDMPLPVLKTIFERRLLMSVMGTAFAFACQPSSFSFGASRTATSQSDSFGGRSVTR